MRWPMILVCGLLVLTGCSREEAHPRVQPQAAPEEEPAKEHDRWGVIDPDAVRERILNMIKEDKDWDRWDEGYMRGMFDALSWEQSHYVYRTTPIPLRGSLINALIGVGSAYVGRTRNEIIALLGPPDCGGEERDIIYTGVGYATDSTSGFIFEFGPDGKVKHVIAAN